MLLLYAMSIFLVAGAHAQLPEPPHPVPESAKGPGRFKLSSPDYTPDPQPGSSESPSEEPTTKDPSTEQPANTPSSAQPEEVSTESSEEVTPDPNLPVENEELKSNNITCENDGQPKCECKPGYEGPTCGARVNHCSAVVPGQSKSFKEKCENPPGYGVCEEDSDANQAYCKCNDGYKGTYCEDKTFTLQACLDVDLSSSGYNFNAENSSTLLNVELSKLPDLGFQHGNIYRGDCKIYPEDSQAYQCVPLNLRECITLGCEFAYGWCLPTNTAEKQKREIMEDVKRMKRERAMFMKP